jgi:putative transposase
LTGSPPGCSTEGCLPHLRQNNALYFVTFRLGDSLPADRVESLKRRRDAWATLNPPPHSDKQQAEYRRIWTGPIERMLDAGHGACELRNPECRQIIEDILNRGDGPFFQLGDWVIMPNHAHVLAHVLPEGSLSSIMKAWKSASTRKINRLLNRRGNLWMEESFDHIVRDEAHWRKFIAYIRKNPTYLPADTYSLGCGQLRL